MNHEEDAALDRLLERASRTALAELAEEIDVEQRLGELHRRAEDPRPAGDGEDDR